jgi:uncharacterized protein YdaU (DUF1376 family)
MKWYKRDPEAFAGGTAELSLEEVGAYTRIIDLIYSRDGNVPDDDMFLCRALRCDIRVWRRIRKRLIETGKIRTSAGLIVNLRATSEISYAQVRMKKDQKRNENKEANLTSTPILTTTTTVTKKEKEERSAPAKRRVLSTLSDDWKPDWELTSAQEVELVKMRDWAKGGAIRKADWLATFRNWLRRANIPLGNVVAMREVIHLREGSPEMAAWDSYLRQTTGLNAIRSKHGGYFPPTRWPPGHEEVA